MTDTKMVGKIVSWSQKGYGFIRATDNHDYFFHIKDVLDINEPDMEAGIEVVFVLGSNAKGPKAIEILRRKEDYGNSDLDI